MADTDKQLAEYRSVLPQTPEALQDQRRRVSEILKSVMQRGVHYDVIGRRLKPGETPKPGDYSLLKPGAELLLQTFHIGLKRHVEDISRGEEVHYRVHSQGIYLPTGHLIGEGIGECSSREEKYAWRAAVCEDEFNLFPQNRRRIKYKTEWQNNRPSGHSAIMQVRQDPQDQVNTILKMAAKRADVDLVRTALAVSDIFAEPGEPGEGPGEESIPTQTHRGKSGSYEEAMARHARPRKPAPGDDQGPPEHIQPNQIRILQNSLSSCSVAEADLLRAFGINTLDALPFAKINEALEWIRSHVAGGGDA